MKLRILTAAALLAACSHGEPYRIPTYVTRNGIPGATRLTYNVLVDTEAAWLPDGSALFYSALRPDFPDTTFCVEQLPPRGGESEASWCPIGAVPGDSSRAYQAPSVSPSGRMMYLRSTRTRPQTGWQVRQLMLTDLLGAQPRAILSSPFQQFTGLSQIRWLTGDRFVFRADMYYLQYGCSSCLPIEADTGLFVIAGDLTTDPPTFTVLSGISNPTSIAVASSDTILFTVSGDTRLYRRAMASGVIDTVRDFAPQVPDAVQLAGRRLVLTLNGRPALASLDSAMITVISDSLFNGLALSPDGRLLVGQHAGDLYEFVLP